MPTTAYYPPVGFHFSVEFTGLPSKANDNLFQSVSGLSVEVELEEVVEGGENRFKHKLPVRTKYSNLVLKRGMLQDSEVIKWLTDSTGDLDFKPKDLTIKLLDEEGNPLTTWNVVHAYPVKWNMDEFNAMESKLLAETIELAYSYFNTL